MTVFSLQAQAMKVSLKTVTPQTEYAASLLKPLTARGRVVISVSGQGAAEGFTLSADGRDILLSANDAPGAIYGANRLKEYYMMHGSFRDLPVITEAPRMKLRGACLGLQKTEYLPGHTVYEYPYTPENFPWFYDKSLWTRYLDMLAADNMNTVYLWNGHPFASLVKLDDYPFAPEVDEATMALNREMFTFLTTEASRRGIKVIQMFYNIILSKPFADHYGLKTQDRNRPVTPLIADYTRKSIAAFVREYPNVGFLVCLGEAMATIDDDVQWMKEVIIPGVKDGLKASGRTDMPPIILRAHDTDGPRVLKESLPLYPNIYTMSKYTGESLTTYQPGGPWGETHRQLAAAAPVHIDNVHILANLEPFRWSSPAFTQKAVGAMHRVHHASGLHLYPQASYWDWPYTADRLSDGRRLLQIDRDRLWYAAWGRYAWNEDRGDDRAYWVRRLSLYYGTDTLSAAKILEAYDESGEIAPKLLRRFGITEGNRQTLLLGMRISQLVNPYKYTVYPGFYESCGPKGEKLIEYVEKEWKGEKHEGELPLDIVDECVAHGQRALLAVSQARVNRHATEFLRLQNDIRAYELFARAFRAKVLAAAQVLNYKWSKDTACLHAAVPLLEMSLNTWRQLAGLTDSTYLYANSMQTAQRRIPIGGNDGHYKTWREMVPVYEEELACLKANIAKLSAPAAVQDRKIRPWTDALAGTEPAVRLAVPQTTVRLESGALLYEARQERVDTLAPELAGLTALVLNRDTTRIRGAVVEADVVRPVSMLVGFYKDDDPKWARPPKLEVDATGNEYGQAEPVLTGALAQTGMPVADIHTYHLTPGHHRLYLPKGIIMVAGFTEDSVAPRAVGINGAGDDVDWLFTK